MYLENNMKKLDIFHSCARSVSRQKRTVILQEIPLSFEGLFHYLKPNRIAWFQTKVQWPYKTADQYP